MGVSLSGMSNQHYQRNPVTGYFRLGQYQWVPNLKTLISVEVCGKVGANSWILHTKWSRFQPFSLEFTEFIGCFGVIK